MDSHHGHGLSSLSDGLDSYAHRRTFRVAYFSPQHLLRTHISYILLNFVTAGLIPDCRNFNSRNWRDVNVKVLLQFPSATCGILFVNLLFAHTDLVVISQLRFVVKPWPKNRQTVDFLLYIDKTCSAFVLSVITSIMQINHK